MRMGRRIARSSVYSLSKSHHSITQAAATMKRTKNMTMFLIGAFALGIASLHAQVVDGDYDPQGNNEEGPKNVRVMLEWIDTSQETVTELLAEETKDVNDTELRAKVAELINAKKAFVFETQMVTKRTGAPARAESVREEIYPGVYYPPELPNVVKVDDDGDGTPNVPVTVPTPIAFDMRMVGGTFELEPAISSNPRDCDIQLDAEWVKRVATSIYASFDDGRAKTDIQMPIYYTERIKSQYTLQRGKPTLIAVLTPPDENGKADRTRKHLLFLRVDVMVVGK